MEVIGVRSSWDTLDTNSCLDVSSTFIRPSTLLKASPICSVSTQSVTEIGSLLYPSCASSSASVIFSKGLIRILAASTETIVVTMITITSTINALRLKISIVTLMLSVDALTSMTPLTISFRSLASFSLPPRVTVSLIGIVIST